MSNSETKIMDLLRKESYLRSSDIIKKTGMPSATIRRKLSNMVKDGEIIRINLNEFETYGIKGKGNETYYARTDLENTRQHLAKVFDTLEDGNEKEKNLALRELEGIQQIKFKPKDLEIFEDIIRDSKDEKLLENLGRIFFNNVESKIIPKNIKEIMKEMDKKITKNNVTSQIGKYFLRTLAYLEHPKAIYWLKHLIKQNKYDGQMEIEWNTTYVAKVVEKHKTELFEFSKTLNDEQEMNLSRIRAKAHDNYNGFWKKHKAEL